MTALAAPERSAPAATGRGVADAPPSSRALHGDLRLLSALAIRLAAGDAAAADLVEDWPALLSLARRERLAAVAWHRVGGTIRVRADARTAGRWRQLWADAVRSGEASLGACAEAMRTLSSAGVRVVLLKGAPLADALYGDACVRCSDDVDCYVPLAHRALAERALTEAGWRCILGQAPDDQTFASAGAAGEVRLEVHSALVPQRLQHLGAGEPDSVERQLGGRVLPVHAGPLVPAYLSAHLATHFAPPLLWWLDLHHFWRALEESERSAALRAAREAGLGGYLGWALRGVDALERSLHGDARALRRVGVRPEGRRDVHQLWRHLTLAPTTPAALAALRGWLRPSWAAQLDGGPVMGTVRRVLRLWRSLLPSSPDARVGAATTAHRAKGRTAPVLSASGVLEAARSVTAAGGELALTLTGDSMAPTIRAGDTVLLGARRSRTRRGDIVLVALGPARPAIHRVRRASGSPVGGLVQTLGDNCSLPDVPVPDGAVVALVIASQRAAVWTVHVPTLRFGVGAAVRGMALALRARAARLRRGIRRWRAAARVAALRNARD